MNPNLKNLAHLSAPSGLARTRGDGLSSGFPKSEMPATICPSCNARTPRSLEYTSAFAHVNYYRCERVECGHIWTTDKETGAILQHVTRLPAAAARPAPPVTVG